MSSLMSHSLVLQVGKLRHGEARDLPGGRVEHGQTWSVSPRPSGPGARTQNSKGGKE